MNIDWQKIEKIFFVGIKGVGMTPLAVIAKESGFTVEGSDLAEEFITDEVLKEKNIIVHEGFDPNVLEGFFKDERVESCLVITTGAHGGYDNPQVVKAKEMNISYLNQGQALGIFMKGLPFNKKLKGITVTGSHGKTTVSAMLSSSLTLLNLDPTYSVGTSRIFPIGVSGHYGNGEYFVAEGDEYVGEPVYDKTPKILYQKPLFAIINNIDFDHPDIYKDINDIKKVMTDFVNDMEENGKVFINGDDINLSEIKKGFRNDIEVFSYGDGDADYAVRNIHENIGSITFEVLKKEESLGTYILNIPAIHNVKNALGAVALMDQIGISNNDKISVIGKYKGSKRRMETVGETEKGVIIIDDYGHHPVEIKSTLSALKKFYNKKIICVFQSHTYSRTRSLLNEFANSFEAVEELILLPIFKSQRDTEQDILTHEEFIDPFIKNGKKVYPVESIADAVSFLEKKDYDNNYLIVTIGAGDVYKVGYELIKK